MFGVNVVGMNAQELNSARSIAFKAIEPRPAAKSRTMALALMGDKFDPMHKASAAPIGMLHRALWEGWLPRRVLSFAFEQAQQRATSWLACRGPIGAAVLSLRRLGWQCEGLFKWTSPSGDVHDIGSSSPWVTNKLVKRSVELWQTQAIMDETQVSCTKHDVLPFKQLRRWTQKGLGCSQASKE